MGAWYRSNVLGGPSAPRLPPRVRYRMGGLEPTRLEPRRSVSLLLATCFTPVKKEISNT